MRPTSQREPAVSGRFYPADAPGLERELNRYLGSPAHVPRPALAIMAPHAGYVYSGPIAGSTYAAIEVPKRAIVICPNHSGLGVRRSLWDRGVWRLPGGDVPIDERLARALVEGAALEPDADAHLYEHAIEVQLPFLRARQPQIQVVPLVLAHLSYADCERLGRDLARVIQREAQDPHEILIVASSDMSHYVSADTAKRLDGLALERVLALDPRGLYETVVKNQISMCGFVPTSVALVAALELGASHAELRAYGNSGDASGDYQRVVGYAGVCVD